MRPTSAQLVTALGLSPHPEGGYYLETYRAGHTVRTSRGERPASTAILFLIASGSISHLHRLSSDELWVFQGGMPLELVTIAEDGTLGAHVLAGPEGVVLNGDGDSMLQPPPAEEAEGPAGTLLQSLVPAGSWQGARLAGGPHLPAERAWSLVSCVVSPGFDYSDFELGEPAALLAAYPQHAAVIRELT